MIKINCKSYPAHFPVAGMDLDLSGIHLIQIFLLFITKIKKNGNKSTIQSQGWLARPVH
jgi:hypothetical protein